MTDAENVTDSDRLDEALGQLRGVTVDAATIRAHVMRPANVLDVTSDQGLDVERVPTWTADCRKSPELRPRPERVRQFDPGRVRALCSPQSDALERERGADRDARVGWAKEPQDGPEGWTPDIRQHVASLSKQPTAIATTGC